MENGGEGKGKLRDERRKWAEIKGMERKRRRKEEGSWDPPKH